MLTRTRVRLSLHGMSQLLLVLTLTEARIDYVPT